MHFFLGSVIFLLISLGIFASPENDLTQAIYNDNVEGAKLLIRSVSNINRANQRAEFPFLVALERARSKEMINIFIENGADINLKIDLNDGYANGKKAEITYPLFIAARNANAFTSIAKHPKINTKVSNSEGKSIETFVSSSKVGLDALCTLFNTKKFNFKSQDKNGDTPLEIAITDNASVKSILLKIFLKMQKSEPTHFGMVLDSQPCLAFLMNEGTELPNDKGIVSSILGYFDQSRSQNRNQSAIALDDDFALSAKKYNLIERATEIVSGIVKSKEEKEREYFRNVAYRSWKEIAVDGDEAIGKIARIGMRIKILESYGFGAIENSGYQDTLNGGIFEIHFSEKDKTEIKKHDVNDIVFVKFKITKIYRDKQFNVASGAIGDMLEIVTSAQEFSRNR
ncbi:ankyrin repeat domain-containing protein [Leptospira levettii]|uniref:ankyrin repeat domain-containing protein n=1 Tax=Leptospira levettii TaxID=2023178 RepID=UPI0010928E1E|nr:ankyrin repeat domain-containing protein [Leptospira levettii]TGM78612.1 ankyrin repeat domain-containing protein [Leptospira levettii]